MSSMPFGNWVSGFVAALFVQIVLGGCDTRDRVVDESITTTSTPALPQDTRFIAVRLSRGPCFGTCPVYSVTIYGNGDVWYTGMQNVQREGPVRRSLAGNDLAELERVLHSGDVIAAEGSLCLCLADCQVTTLKIEAVHTTRTVRFSDPRWCKDETERASLMPLWDLASSIDRLSGAVDWAWENDAH